MFSQSAASLLQRLRLKGWMFGFQEERTPKKHLAEEFEEFDYSDLYEDLSISTVTAGPNVTDYEVSLSTWGGGGGGVPLLSGPLVTSCVRAGTQQVVQYEDYDNATDLSLLNEYEYEEEEEEEEERYGPAVREGEVRFNAQVRFREPPLVPYSSQHDGSMCSLSLRT